MHSRDEPQGFNLAHDECGDRLRPEADERLNWSHGCVEKPKKFQDFSFWAQWQ
jgi:hypothetical protein